jgi:murein DD-endopeptidase MepM/ murein hydrolase activator NlpD
VPIAALLPLVVGAMSFAPAPSSPLAAPPIVAAIEAAPGAGAWTWPVHGPVVRGFDPPDTPYGSGHRGIDVAAPVGTEVVAAEAGVVAFAGPVGGHLFVTIDHGGGLESTYSWLSALLVRRGDVVARGAPIATSGPGHPGSSLPHLHFGVRLNDVYQDPLAYLGPVSVSDFIRLAPIEAS